MVYLPGCEFLFGQSQHRTLMLRRSCRTVPTRYIANWNSKLARVAVKSGHLDLSFSLTTILVTQVYITCDMFSVPVSKSVSFKICICYLNMASMTSLVIQGKLRHTQQAKVRPPRLASVAAITLAQTSHGLLMLSFFSCK